MSLARAHVAITAPMDFSRAMQCLGLTPQQAELVWLTLPREAQKKVQYYLSKCAKRPLGSPAKLDAAVRTFQVLTPQRLLGALEHAAERGVIRRCDASQIQDLFLRYVGPHGGWKA